MGCEFAAIAKKETMPGSEKSFPLPEEDYQAIGRVVDHLHQCRTRGEVVGVFGDALLPLFCAQAGFYGWTDPDIHGARVIDAVQIPEDEVAAFQEYLPYWEGPRHISSQGRPVLASGLDFPEERMTQSVDRFFQEHPEFERSQCSFLDRLRAVLCTVDLPDPTIKVGFFRVAPHEMPFTRREARLLELIRPHLLQTIKATVFTEELDKYQSMAQALADLSAPIALVSDQTRVIFQNRSFEELFGLNVGDRLTQELGDLVQKEIAKFRPPYTMDHAQMDIPFYTVKKGVYRLSLTRLEGKHLGETRFWLLRMKPAVEPYSRMNLLMQQARLTGREMEICCLIREGIDDKEIASRLFISLYTAKNHIKNIHKKLGVRTRAQLVALLNQ